jgi:hypothetical protein
MAYALHNNLEYTGQYTCTGLSMYNSNANDHNCVGRISFFQLSIRSSS